MNKDVLVLNRGFLPLHIIDWKRSIILLTQDKCRTVDSDYIQYTYDMWKDYTNKLDSDDYNYIHTINYRVALPHVVVLHGYDKLPRNQVKYSRESVFQRDKFKCAYCGKVFQKKDLTIDHINPKSYGGTRSWKNSISACFSCNSRKANRTPDEANMPLLFQPSEPNWYQQMKTIVDKPNLKDQWKPFLESVVSKHHS